VKGLSSRLFLFRLRSKNQTNQAVNKSKRSNKATFAPNESAAMAATGNAKMHGQTILFGKQK